MRAYITKMQYLLLPLVLYACAGDSVKNDEGAVGAVLESGPRLEEQVSPAAYLRLARNMEAQGDMASAMNLYARAMDAGEDVGAATTGYVRLALMAGDLTAVEAEYGAFLEASRDPALIAAWARALARSGRVGAADGLLGYMLAGEGGVESVELWTLRGIVDDILLQHDTAREIYDIALRKAAEAGANSTPIVRSMALSYALTGDYDVAGGLLDQIKGAPGEQASRAIIRAMTGDSAGATDMMRAQLSAEGLRRALTLFEVLQDLEGEALARAVMLNDLMAR